MEKNERLLSLSLDLDNQWSYMKIHGDSGWDQFPSYLARLSELVLDRLDRHGLRITVFVVGQDAARSENRPALQAFAEAGHEIANHSFHHEPWLHLYDEARIEHELAEAETHIMAATGRRPRGFRGPGFSLSAATLRVLTRREYLYDASTFPTVIGPLARAYYFWHSRNLSPTERTERRKLFGTFRDGCRSLKPYFWQVADDQTLLEIPVTTIPLVRLPMHLSYLVYLATFSGALSSAYLHAAVGLCRVRRIQPSFLLHPLDFLGKDMVDGLGFFPGMELETKEKLKRFDTVIEYLKQHYRVISMAEHATAIVNTGAAPIRSRVLA